ncbi:MAG: DUF4111 domain-containing protein [Chloroflexota bacterium]|nr:MAG: DUF4111 domain-containing protein [Chloroflexota bacterium]
MNETHPTLYPELNEVLQDLVTNIQVILGNNFLGAYLQGSFAVGDFDQHSDVDFIVVMEDDIASEHIPLLQEMHTRIFKLTSPWAQHLEGSYFPKEILRQAPHRDEQVWYLDNGSSVLIRSNHCNTLVVRWVLREHEVILTGPTPKDLIDPVPAEALRREIREVIHDWGRELLSNPQKFNNRFYQSFIVLSYCRMLHDLILGSVTSKRTGAEWAKTNLDPSWKGLIDRTWAARPNPEISIQQPADGEDFQHTLEFVAYVIEESKKFSIS